MSHAHRAEGHRVIENPAFAYDRYVSAVLSYMDALDAWQAAGRTGSATITRTAALATLHAAQAEWNALDTADPR